jgi:hypothetical protein
MGKPEEKISNGNPTKHLAFKVVAYLRQHPGARDNLKGIAEWWLAHPVEAVKGTLEYLHDKGFLQKSNHNGQTLYSRSHNFAEKHLERLLLEIASELE